MKIEFVSSPQKYCYNQTWLPKYGEYYYFAYKLNLFLDSQNIILRIEIDIANVS